VKAAPNNPTKAPCRSSRTPGERIFGINADSTALVALAVAVSLSLATVIWIRSGIYAPLAITLFAVGATVFGAREVVHQISEHRTNLIVVASTIAALHIAAALSAVVLIRNRRTSVRMADPDLSGA
jgi:ABC-type uncharacterized transport system permease subunit